MAVFCGIDQRKSVIEQIIEPEFLEEVWKNPLILRRQAIMTQREWEKISEYYIINAPIKLTLPEPNYLDWPEDLVPEYPPIYRSPPSTILFQYLNHSYWMGDARTGNLQNFTSDYQPVASYPLTPGTIQLDTLDGMLLALCMGKFTPGDKPLGQMIAFNETSKAKIIIDSLSRPVHFSVADFDKDGLKDLVVACYGKWIGGVYLYRNLGNWRFQKNQLYSMPGAIKIKINDLNRDSWPDLLVLMGQGDEKILYFENQSGNDFEQETLLRFPAAYGSTDFDIADIDEDGFPEIIYTNGDNGDYQSPVKPYHGVSIFSGNLRSGFQRTYFEWIPGAYGVKAGKIDGDGTMDLLVNSFFPDYRPSNCYGLHFLKGGKEGYTHFARSDCKEGRWIRMDLADTDQDGDLDILLANLAFEAYPDTTYVDGWVKQGLPFLLIQNKLNEKK